MAPSTYNRSEAPHTCVAGSRRIVSLVPAATEIVAALGLADRLVGISHACDFPDSVCDLPRVTACTRDMAGQNCGSTDRIVRATRQAGRPLFEISRTLMDQLEPEIILSQRQCDVCAPGYESVADLASTLARPPRVVNLEARSLRGVFEDMSLIGQALGARRAAKQLVLELEQRLERVAAAVRLRPPVRCVLLEWLDPLYCSGHWTPELIRVAGGWDPLGKAGRRAVPITWRDVQSCDPDYLVISCCGFDLERMICECQTLARRPGWNDLSAVRSGRVSLLDGNAFFSRPGPRIVDGAEILAALLHEAGGCHASAVQPDWPQGTVCKIVPKS